MSIFGEYIPLEYVMFGAIGFLVAWLIALLVFPAVHQRAVRLTRRQYDTIPLSMREMQAEKDRIRAGFAAATRSLELSIEQLKAKTVAHATDLARKSSTVERLRQELDKSVAALAESHTRETTARSDLQRVKLEAVAATEALHQSEQQIAAMKAQLASQVDELARRAMQIETQRIEFRALTPIHRPMPPIPAFAQAPPAATLSVAQNPAPPPKARYRGASVLPPPVQLLTPPVWAPVAHPQQSNDSVLRASAEIEEAARRIDATYASR